MASTSRNDGKESFLSKPNSTDQKRKNDGEGGFSKKSAKTKAKNQGYKCPVWDVRVAAGRRDETRLVHEFWTGHEGGWGWLSQNLARAYLRQSGTEVHPFGQQLTPYNCWPGRSVFYYGFQNQELIWPDVDWSTMSYRVKKVVLRGGIRPDNQVNSKSATDV